MRLNKLLANCNTHFKIENGKNIKVLGITSHSKEIKKNYIFSVINGQKYNGADFISSLKDINNIVLILDKNMVLSDYIPNKIQEKFVRIYTEDVVLISGEIASFLYKNNISNINAVTGTNGKTSIAEYTRQIWNYNKTKAASIGTLGTFFNKKLLFPAKLTTPDSITLHRTLNKLSKKGCKNIIIEASSIGINQNRLFPIKFNKIAFTNLTRDHLDYHKNMQQYMIAKAKIFIDNSHKKTVAILNSDDTKYPYFKKLCVEQKLRVLDYGKKANFLKIISISKKNDLNEIEINLKNKVNKVIIANNSLFEVYNILCSLLIVFGEKINIKDFNCIEKLKSPKGRLEKVYDKDFQIFIDYAHTPDAIKNILNSLNNLKKNRIISIIGCGGDRDKGKRSLLTKQALLLSDIIILADDNPRNEDPKKIRKDMLFNLNKKQKDKIFNIGDRKRAIKYGISILKKGDILVITGKGHEDYQLIKSEKKYFSDHVTVNNILSKI